MSHLRLFFLRHGQTENYFKYPFNGWFDVSLTPKGKSQLDQSVLALKGIKFEAVYSSDLSRALYGGKALAQQNGLELKVSPKWREISFGECEGLNFEDIKTKYPEVATRIFHPDGGELSFPGGESSSIFFKRIAEALQELRSIHSQGKIALVAHAGVCRAILANLLNLKPANMWCFSQDFACLNVVDLYPGEGAEIRLINGYLGSEGYFQSGPGWEKLSD